MTSRERGIVLGGCLIVGAVLGLRAFAGAPEAERPNLGNQRLALARLQGELMALPGLENAGAEVRNKLVRLGPLLLDGNSETAAGASLALLMTLTADRWQLQLERATPLTDSTASGRMRQVAAAAVFTGDGEALASALAALATEHPLIEVQRLSIRAPGAADPPSAPEALEIELEVAGWYLEAVR